MLTLDRKLYRDLGTLKGQVIAIALIVACGITSLVTMTSTYQSLLFSQQHYYTQYRFTDLFVSLKRAPESLMQEITAIPGVSQGRSRVVENVTLDVPGLADPAMGRLISIPNQPQPLLNDLVLRSGRYIQPGQSSEVIASEIFVKANHLALGDHINAIINGHWQPLRIVGTALSPEYIYEISGTEILPDNRRFGVLWMDRQALATAFNLQSAFNDVVLTLTPGANSRAVIFRLDKLLEPYGGLGAYGRDQQLSHRFLSDDLTGLQVMALILPLIFLSIAAFLVNMVLARLITTQRDQIAVMKAFGYSHQEVGLHFFKLVVVVVSLGMGLGLALGYWLGGAFTQFYGRYYHFPTMEYHTSLTVIIGAIALSLVAALAGAMRAIAGVVSLPPAQAMQPEPPASFKPTLLEYLGLQGWLSPPERIILRNLERRPLQASLSAVGIALAVAMLVVGGYFSDGIDQLINRQFHSVQRDDLTLAFVHPLAGRVRYDLAHLPGVMGVEPFRTVPVRLRFEQRSRLASLTGLTNPSTLRRLAGAHDQTLPLPSQGLLITTKLAELLRLQPGQTLTVEILEGTRPVRQVTVVGLVDELVGLPIYMDNDALHRLLGEAPSFSGAFLKVDHQWLPQLYHQLKEMPTVASVAQRQNLVTQFEATIATTFGVMNGVIMLFAIIIAVAVIYNAARIALSERRRDLATLRIIGFTQTEIALILLGEQALITLAALPLGGLLGYGLAWWLHQSPAQNTEVVRIPFTIQPSTYLFATLVTLLAAGASGLLVARQLHQLDLIAVLKTRE
ncbi:MAG: FtsX-like permease family protein [Cyanobacteria bacterium REEB459]|nr:FtsX-like permease family protein [Cyanobacteria bacterium REEB459]